MELTFELNENMKKALEKEATKQVLIHQNKSEDISFIDDEINNYINKVEEIKRLMEIANLTNQTSIDSSKTK